MDVGVTAFILPSRRISVTCSDVTLKCLVLVWSTTDNPDQVHVSLIDSDDDRTVVLSLGATDVSVVVYTWKRGGFVFSGELSFISQLEPLTSKCEFTLTSAIFVDQCYSANIVIAVCCTELNAAYRYL